MRIREHSLGQSRHRCAQTQLLSTSLRRCLNPEAFVSSDRIDIHPELVVKILTRNRAIVS